VNTALNRLFPLDARFGIVSPCRGFASLVGRFYYDLCAGMVFANLLPHGWRTGTIRLRLSSLSHRSTLFFIGRPIRIVCSFRLRWLVSRRACKPGRALFLILVRHCKAMKEREADKGKPRGPDESLHIAPPPMT